MLLRAAISSASCLLVLAIETSLIRLLIRSLERNDYGPEWSWLSLLTRHVRGLRALPDIVLLIVRAEARALEIEGICVPVLAIEGNRHPDRKWGRCVLLLRAPKGLHLLYSKQIFDY